MNAPTPRPATRQAGHPASDPAGKTVVAVASGKGGVGKTWLSITLAHALARLGRRVLLFDGDLGLANVDIQLGLMPDHDLGGFIAGSRGLEQVVTEFAAGGFKIIAGRSGTGALAQLDHGRLEGLKDSLTMMAPRFDHMVLDLGAGIEQPVPALATIGGPVLVVTTAEPTALTDAYAFIKVVGGRHRARDLRVVVNMADDRKSGERTYDKLRKVCQGFLGIAPPLAGIIRRDPLVIDSIRHQTPLLIRHPTSPAAKDVEGLARRLEGPQ